MRNSLAILSGLALFVWPAIASEPASDDPLHPSVEFGAQVYKDVCAHCHGINMVNAGTSSYDLRKWPQDDRERFQNSVLYGRGDMPAWGDALFPGELEALWAYVVTRGGTEDLPPELADEFADLPGHGS
ncbi:MAG: cytochrome c [Pseudomonadota bacterium]